MATYYVDPNGLDSNNGTSPATAWKTIAKVSGFSFASGDSVLFLRGASWAEQLTVSSDGVTFAAYGSGANPIINGTGKGQCVYADTHSNLTLQNLHLTGGGYGLAANIVSGLTVTGLEIDHATDSGIILGNGTANATVSNCIIHDNGSSGTDGNGVGIGGGGAAPHDIVVQNNQIYNSYNDNVRVSMTSDSFTPSNITIKNNTVYGSLNGGGIAADASVNLVVSYNLIYGNLNSSQGEGVYVVPGTGPVENVQIFVYNNTIVGNNFGILATTGAGGTYNVTVKNNLFQNNGTAGSTVEMGITSAATWVSDYNLVYHAAGGNFMHTAAAFVNWAGWLSGMTPNDAHSINANPKLNGDYTLLPGSPAIGTGVFIAGVSTSNPPNIGAFGATVFTPVVEQAGFYNNVALAAGTPTELVGGLGHWDVTVINTGAAAIYLSRASTVAAGDPASFTLPPGIPIRFAGYGPSGVWLFSPAAGSASVQVAPRGQ